MAYAPLRTVDTSTILGRFNEKTHGKVFEYSENDELILAPLAHGGRNVAFPHKLWVGPNGEYRYAFVKNNVAHVIIDEGNHGFITEKWDISKHRKYAA